MTYDGFVNHHVHSHFSVLDGFPSPEQIVNRAVELGQKSISLTDHGTLSGIPQMYRAAKKAGIGFTHGCEMYFTQDRTLHHVDRHGQKHYHLILLAHNDVGYHNLVKLQTYAWDEGFYSKPRIDYEVLSQHSEGLTATTACLGGIVNQALLRGDFAAAKKELGKFVDIFGKENFYVEVQNHGLAEQNMILPDQVELAKYAGIELLATCDSHYAMPNQSGVHDTMLCCSAGGKKHEEKRFKFDSDKFYIHGAEEMYELFPEDTFPRAVSNSLVIADKTDFTMKIDKDKEYIMPSVPTEKGMTESDTLREHVLAGARDISRYGDGHGNIPDDVAKRIDYELGVVDKMGFSGYFLIVENIVKLFAEQGIYTGPGRGCVTGDTKVFTGDGYIPIKDVKIGDKVINSKGDIVRVVNTMKYATYDGEQLVRLTADHGKSITLTDKHKVLVDDGHGGRTWKKAGLIKTSDVVISALCKGYKHAELTIPGCEPMIKNSQLGFIIGALENSVRDGDTFRWFFTPDKSETAETLVACLRGTIDDPLDITDDGNGHINSVSVTSITLQRIDDTIDTALCGIGPADYVRGFLYARMQYNSTDAIRTSFDAGSASSAESTSVAAASAGMQSTSCGDNVEVSWKKKTSSESRHMIVGVERVPAPEYVYDLTVDGDPSYLTEFSTIHNSAPGSVMIYCLGITGMDPLAHDLHFERFLNPDRISMPDIDIDVPKSRRKEALEIIEKEYGVGHVAHLSNYQTLGMRSAMDRVGKAYGLYPAQASEFRTVISDYCEDMGISFTEFAQSPVPSSIADKLPETPYRDKIIQEAAQLEGKMYANGIHACGIVITAEPIDNIFPIRRAKGAILPVCQFDGEDTEALGGVKMDILGLINLDECIDTERNISLDLGEKVDSSALPFDDEAVYELLSQGRGGGVFQLGCLSGDTIVDGITIKEMFQKRNSYSRVDRLRSVFLGEGDVHANRCKKVVYSGKKRTFVLAAGGKTIRATANHKFFTQRGWMPLEAIIPEQDSIITVDDDVFSDEVLLAPVRGREDILNMYEKHHPQLRRIEPVYPVTIEGTTFHPNFVWKKDPSIMVLVYPDHGFAAAETARIKSRGKLSIVSYSEVVEQYYQHVGGEDLLLPIGTQWENVTSIEPYGIEDTYDVMMGAPVHNFIANGFMVHNSSGIRSLSRLMKPTEFSDLSALIALYRPGPMKMGTHEKYSKSKNSGGEEEVIHESLRDILAENHGLVVYQEDIMNIARKLAGYTGAEADDLRKAVAKKVPELMEKHRKKFIPIVNEKYGDNLGDTLWGIIEPFGEYAFNKSHSGAYAALTYRTAWLKAHYPAQFSASVLDQNIGDKTKLVETAAWIREENVTINTPDINTSESRSITDADSLTLPLYIISGLGESSAEGIIDERNRGGRYTSVVDFVARNKIPKSLLSNLAKSGAFDSMGVNRAAVIEKLDEIMSLANAKKNRSEFSDGLFGDFLAQTDDTDDIDLTIEPVRVLDGEKVVTVGEDEYGKWERESLGILIGPHPYSTFAKLDAAERVMDLYPPIDNFERASDNARFSGVMYGIENRVSKKGKEFCTFTLETDVISVPSVAFSHIDPSYEGALVIAEGKIEDDSSFSGDEGDFTPKAVCYSLKTINMEKMKGQ